MQQGMTQPRGSLTAQRIARQVAPLAWRLRNRLRWSWLKGWIATHLIAPFANAWGVATMIARLDAVLIKANGERVYYDALSFRVITDAGVAFLVDDWDSSAVDITDLHFHGCGTGTNAEAVGDTALQTESTTALNPDSTRATGTESQPAANQLRTVGTLTFDNTAAVTEHGIFSQAATGGGTLWDRSVFSAINVVSGDSIQFTYTCTVSSGG
jgi:hypothetical protein